MRERNLQITAWVLTLLALIGFFDATYLTAEHYLGGTPPCFITTGCEEVTTSEYSTFQGVPIALVGMIYYLALFILGLALAQGPRMKYLNIILAISGAGFLSSLYLVYLQLFVLDAVCSYCMVSAVTSTAIFISSLIIRKKFTKNGPSEIVQ
jgi:uncharacterized membrane protein